MLELLSISLARAVWFVNANELNPSGVSLVHSFVPAFVERYKFVQYPAPSDLVDDRNGYKFSVGSFKNSQGTEVEIAFTSFRDGLVADTRSSTRDSDAFLEDLAGWAAKEFGLGFQSGVISRRAYLSQMYVRSDCQIGVLNQKLNAFSERLSSLVSDRTDKFSYEPSGIAFSLNPLGRITPGEFRFEREINAPFSERRYYSQSPTHTDTHLELLSEFEAILTALN